MTGFYYHSRFLAHETGSGHPERPARLSAIIEHLRNTGVIEKLNVVEPKPAGVEAIAQVHPKSYIEWVESSCRKAPGYLDSDTVVSEHSFDAARLAVGAAVDAAQKVCSGEFKNAFCAVRPPGHHAEVNRAMGFCLFNNVAIAAEWLRRKKLAERVLIIDWDVHHGNGTQNIFYERGDVFYMSFHQWPLYPGTGRAEETGSGEGEGTTLNVLISPQISEEDYLDRFYSEVENVFQNFRPDFTLLSAGFDAHVDDPLANLRLTDDGYFKMTDFVLSQVKLSGNGKLLSLLEGGYNLDALAKSVERHVECLIADR